MDNKKDNIDEMSIDEVTLKINELYKKSKEDGLNDEEKELQQKLRQRYIDSVKRNFKAQLAGIKPNKKK
ncbi:DUF896 domain-containing protein [Clostridium sardiniense]|nr:DUF896 domain-containing protein [Clostridium sardiniense]MBM7834966.1 uncharacterized protein YnzC (UPF0291/DUF896 family) [Clostridium sardiniense]MDQ0460387.1 uncharacterized protein YnzC (UPF0291/DUF896 family) [Clostridium sardiniense]